MLDKDKLMDGPVWVRTWGGLTVHWPARHLEAMEKVDDVAFGDIMVSIMEILGE